MQHKRDRYYSMTTDGAQEHYYDVPPSPVGGVRGTTRFLIINSQNNASYHDEH